MITFRRFILMIAKEYSRTFNNNQVSFCSCNICVVEEVQSTKVDFFNRAGKPTWISNLQIVEKNRRPVDYGSHHSRHQFFLVLFSLVVVLLSCTSDFMSSLRSQLLRVLFGNSQFSRLVPIL